MLAGRGGRCMHRAQLALRAWPRLARRRRGAAAPGRVQARLTITLPLTLTATARRRSVPFLLQAVRQGLQDLGARDLPAARAALAAGAQRVEARSSSAQVPPAHRLIRLNILHLSLARCAGPVRVAARRASVWAPHGGC